MAVHGNLAAFAEKNPRKHYFLANDELPLQRRIQDLAFNILPSNIFQLRRSSCSAHRTLQNNILHRCGFLLRLFHVDPSLPTTNVCPTPKATQPFQIAMILVLESAPSAGTTLYWLASATVRLLLA